MVRKHDPTSMATAKGHLDRTRQGLNSTKEAAGIGGAAAAAAGVTLGWYEDERISADTSRESDAEWIPMDKKERTNGVLFKVIRPRLGRNHMDATGRFPVESEQGNGYLMVFVCEDSNYVHFETLKDRSAAEHTAAFRRGFKFFEARGFRPKIERLDNECSQQLLDEMQKICGIKVELVPPTNHRALKAERGIRTAKNHLISVWATADSHFPMRLWDHLEQPEMVLNMMRGSNITPHLSAWQQLHGPYDNSKHPLAPFGMRICAHEPAATRQPFGQRCVKGYLLGCSPLHHRSWRVAIDNGGTRVTDTIAWFPEDYVMPGASPVARLDAALREVSQCSKTLVEALKRGKDGSDREVISREGRQALDELANLYTNKQPQQERGTTAEVRREMPRAEPALVGEQQEQQQKQRAGEDQRVPADSRQDLRVSEDTSEPEDISSIAQERVPTASSAMGPATSKQGGAAGSGARFDNTLGDARTKRKAKARTKKNASSGENAPAAPQPAAVVVEKAGAAEQKTPPAAVTATEQQEEPSVMGHVHATEPPGHKHGSRAQRQPAVAWRNLKRGRNQCKRVARREHGSSPSQPEYVIATEIELQRYTVRQLKDLMRDHEISAAGCSTREDLVEAIVTAKAEVRHKLSARETLAHVRATTSGQRASKAQRAILARAARVHAVTASAVRAAADPEHAADSETAAAAGPVDSSEPRGAEAFAYATTDERTGETLVWRRLIKPENPGQAIWIQATDEEWDRLIEGTETLEFIDPEEKESGRTASYMSMAASLKPDSEGKLTVARVRGAYGGNVTDYAGPRSANTASHAAVKTLLNAIVSDPKAKCLTADAKDFYLMTVLDKVEYMWIEPGQIPQRTFEKYGLKNRKTNSKGNYMVRVKRGMYGLPHAGRLAAIKVTALLAKAGYHECRHNKMVFRHDTRDVTFTLVVDDFLIKYSERADAEHLIRTLEEVYVMKTDWEAKKYLGITLDWDYNSAVRTVTLSMPNYVEKGVQRFSQWLGADRRVTHGPGSPAPRVFGVQPAKVQEEAPALPAEEKTELQRLVGYFRYYAEAIDSTQLVKLGQLASQQNAPTEATKREARDLLDYVATWPNATLVFRASDMILRSISDGSHRGEPRGGSRIGGIHFYGSKGAKEVNGAVQIVCKLLDVQSSSACETELGALYENGRVIAGLRNMASEFGYPQEQPTEVECDNQCAVGIAGETEKQKRAAAMDMRFLWVADRVRQGQIRVSWSKGEGNLADYVTKIHPHKHHREMRKFFVRDPPLDPSRQMTMKNRKN